jgi:hypothetical protein
MNKMIVMTMMMIKKLFLILLLFSISGVILSQNDDFGLWFGINAKHEFIKNLDAELSGSVRTFNNSSQIEQLFIEGGVQYRLNKTISFNGSYRLSSVPENDTKYYYRHKLFLGVKATLPYHNFSFSARAMLQRTSKTYIENENDLIPKSYIRLKLKGVYNISSFPLKPYIYMEPFVPVFAGSGFLISEYRLSSGIELQISRKSSIETEYIFKRDYQPHISNEHIISINYNIKF